MWRTSVTFTNREVGDANLPEILEVRLKLMIKNFPHALHLTEFTTAQPPCIVKAVHASNRKQTYLHI